MVAFLLIAAMMIGGCDGRASVYPPGLHNLSGSVEIRQVCNLGYNHEDYHNSLLPVLAAFDAAGYEVVSVAKDETGCTTVVGQKRLPTECPQVVVKECVPAREKESP